MKEIKLTNSDKIALVDDDKYEELNKYNWRINESGYVIRTKINKENANYPEIIYMHRQILDILLFSSEICTDHINHIRTDNTLVNLRKCTKSENGKNIGIKARKTKNTTSKFKGVCWHAKGKKWGSSIMVNYKSIHIGLFDDEIRAALAYDQIARILHKNFATLNFPNKCENIVEINKITKFLKGE